ncbi:GRF1-interacting factor 3-like [Gossypium australe]|uniref:GRF1-interacting factor 3-like n=1 Tax=Gossypium australe TaxID=47621 RepID=A0A5B6UYU9_9ROSI|nr:GRF1-interacting factor 3-like [Gossypium australe]
MPQPPQMIPVMPSYPPTNITTEQIQKQRLIEGAILSLVRSFFLLCLNSRKTIYGVMYGFTVSVVFVRFRYLLCYLDENKKLILAILDNQNLGKLAECAQYQAQLQKNLMYLAAIADAQPQSMPPMPPQMAPHPAIPTGGYFMQHPQAAAMGQQPGMYPQKVPLQFNNPHQMQDPQHLLHQQHQQAMQGQMGIRPGGPNNGMHPMHSEASLGGGSSAGPPQSSGPSDGRAGNKQNPETGANGQGSTTSDRAEEGK